MVDGKLGLGIAGCGSSVWMFGPALVAQEKVGVVAWMDPDRGAAERAAARYPAAVTTDYGEMLRHPGLDAVLIASPPWMHLPQAAEAAAAGKHVLCEKPMARDLTECRLIIEACERGGVLLMVGFMKRFNPAFRMAKEMVQSGELGEVFEIRCDWGWPQYFLAGWRDSIRTRGGLLQDHGSHTVDLCRWWAGEIASVSAEVRAKLEGREVEDYAHVVCRHSSGCVSVHRHTRLTHETLHERYRIEGTKGALELECRGQWSPSQAYNFTARLHRSSSGLAGSVTDILLQPEGGMDRQMEEAYSYTGELRYFAEHVTGRGEMEMCRGEDGLRAIEVLNAAYLSSAEGRTIPLPLAEGYDLEEAFRVIGSGARVRS